MSFLNLDDIVVMPQKDITSTKDNAELIEDFRNKWGIMKAFSESGGWKMACEVLDNSIKKAEMDIKKLEDKITEMPAEEFKSKLIEIKVGISSMKHLKLFPNILMTRFQNSVDALTNTKQEPNFIKRLLNKPPIKA